LSADGLTLWFVSDMPGGMGGKDLWKVPVMPSGEIGIPENAGPAINTLWNEDYPSVWGDSLLVFASNGHTGMGGMDTFYCWLEGNGTGQPVNAGAPLNSTFDDHCVWFDDTSEGGLFCSNRNAGQGSDIFRFRHSFISLEKLKVTSRDNGDIRDRKDNTLTRQKMSTKALPVLEETKEEVSPVAELIQLPALTESIPETDNTLVHSPDAEISGETTDLTDSLEKTVYFRIQIAAAVKPITSFGQFSKLNDLIDLYGLSVDKAGSHYKYRIGNFDSREVAIQVLQTIRGRGFRDSFIVPVE